MSLTSRYSGSRCPGDAENFVVPDFKKSEEKKDKMGCPISKKIEKMTSKVAKMKETQIMETMKMPCITYNNTKIATKKGKNEKKKHRCPISKKDHLFWLKAVKRSLV